MYGLMNKQARLQASQEMKNEGNSFFKQKLMAKAIKAYTRALEPLDSSLPEHFEQLSVCYANRAAAYLGMEADKLARRELSEAFGALSTEIEQSMWEAEVLRSFDAAERDAQESVNFNDENHKGHFRLGMARLELATRDPGAEQASKLSKALEAFHKANNLQPSAKTKELIGKASEMVKRYPIADPSALPDVAFRSIERHLLVFCVS